MAYQPRAPPRRKSCGECSKSKRRCDLQFPACSRCTRQNLDCHYLLPPHQRENYCPPTGSYSTILPATASPQSSHDSSASHPPSVEVADEAMLNAEFDLSFLDDTWKEIDQACQAEMSPPDHWMTSPKSRAFSVPAGLLTDAFSPAASRVDYTLKILRDIPSQMVSDNSTPWSHPLLYKDCIPKSMHDAHAACALYIARNETNKAMIFRAIDIRAKELLAEPKPLTPVDTLARAQSLLLYQIIRLFDGDIRLRADAEAAMRELEREAYTLLRLLDDNNMIPSSSSSTPDSTSSLSESSFANVVGPMPDYGTWIFQESCRRTYLFSFFLIGIYSILKGGCCREDLYAATRSWIISAPLWHARSEFDFKVAWREKRMFIIHKMDFDQVLATAMPGDICELGKMLLVAVRGLDEIREWFWAKGAQFE